MTMTASVATTTTTPTIDNNDVNDDDDDFEFQVPKKKNNQHHQQRRIYIGGLPPDLPNLEQELTAWIQEQVPNVVDISVQVQTPLSSSRKGTTFALVDCGNNSGSAVISKLHQRMWHGKKLTVQREKKQQNQNQQRPQTQQRKTPNKTGAKNHSKHNNTKKNAFTNSQKKQSWGKSWSKPEEEEEQQRKPQQSCTPIPIDQATADIGDVVTNEIKNAQENGEDVMNVALASTAAASLLAAMNAFEDDNDKDDGNGTTTTTTTMPTGHVPFDDDEKEKEDPGVFKLQDMSTLLADFGQEDKNWMKMAVVEKEEEKVETTSRLAPHGKAPIHIIFRSFGYNYGAPKRPDGWTIAQPLAPLDCSHDFEPVPPYLKWMSGLSGAVKRAIDPALYDYAKIVVADQVWDCLLQAQESGYGYASPLTMTIYLGSESGRHRSVAACEKAATELRSRLRKNVNNVITQPVSIGTAHRDIDKNSDRNRKKSKGGDSDDEAV